MNKEKFLKVVNHVKNWFEGFTVTLEEFGDDNDKDKKIIEKNKEIVEDLSNIESFLDELIQQAKEECIKPLEKLDKKYACGCYAIAIKAIREV